ncbi:MAG: DNA translocase FtsK [Clostridiales Family XIII bacterium]|jgi:S-DNA-T family DNA segregation ATPase FtsK/SpoIIIE|nr:DNA translocase FtsK [Clostridiales Family XIII bacterium]
MSDKGGSLATGKKSVKKRTGGGAGKKRGSDPLMSFRMYEEVKAIVLLAVGVFLVFAMFADVAGVVGERVSYGCKGALGAMAYVLPFVLITYGIAIFANKGYSVSVRTHIFVIIMFVMLMLLISAFWLGEGKEQLDGDSVARIFAASAAGKGGGVVGMYAGALIIGLIGKAGLFILSIAALAVSALLFARTTLSERFERIATLRADMRARREAREKGQRRLEEAELKARARATAGHARSSESSDTDPDLYVDGGGAAVATVYEPARGGIFSLFGGLQRNGRDHTDKIIDAVKNADEDVSGMTGLLDEKIKGLVACVDLVEDAGRESSPEIPVYGIEPRLSAPLGRGLGDDFHVIGNDGVTPPASLSAATEAVSVQGPTEQVADSSTEGTGLAGSSAEGPRGWIDSAAEGKDAGPRLGLSSSLSGFVKKRSTAAYKLPPVNLLKKSQPSARSENDNELRAKAHKLEETLRDFRVDAKVLKVTVGPTVTRYEVEPDIGVKIQSIKSLESDLALRLEVKSVRVVPMPGQAVVGIEAYNSKRGIVTLREIIDSSEFMGRESKIAFALGKNISGDRIIADLADMPHLLIAGTTGSGKSVCINSILLSIMYKATPDEVKLILVDPKVVELKPYNDIPHLLLPVVTSPERAATALGYAVTIMNERYAKFAEFNVRNLAGYNSLMIDEGRGEEILPQIVIVIDELSDLMMIAPQKVQESISRLAAMARAAGMHLIVATQQPLASILTSVIKANIPSRIAFSVSSNSASRVILDEPGAERLHGKGDMLFSPVGTREPMRVQGSFVSEAEVYKVTEYVKKEMDPDYSPDVLDVVNGGIPGDLTEDEDELFRDAVEAVVAAKQASVSMLQRRFRIGYNRSARLVDMMEERGMVAPSDGTNKPRKVLMTESQFESYLSGSSASVDASVAGGSSETLNEVRKSGSLTDVSGAVIAPVSHSVYGGVPGGEPVDNQGSPLAYAGDLDGDTDVHITDISDLIGDDDPPFSPDED